MLTTTQSGTAVLRIQPQQLVNCPSCHQLSTFTDGGIQHCPPRVAKATGLPEKLQLYHCDSCKSTLSELDLLKRR